MLSAGGGAFHFTRLSVLPLPYLATFTIYRTLFSSLLCGGVDGFVVQLQYATLVSSIIKRVNTKINQASYTRISIRSIIPIPKQRPP